MDVVFFCWLGLMLMMRGTEQFKPVILSYKSSYCSATVLIGLPLKLLPYFVCVNS